MTNILKKIRWIILVELVFHFLFEIGVVAIPGLNKWLFDNIFNISYGQIGLVALAYLGLRLFIQGTQYISQYFAWKQDAQFQKNLRNELFGRYISQPFKSFKEKISAQYLSKLTNQVETLEKDWLEPVTQIIISTISLIVYTVTMVIIVDWRLTLLLVVLSVSATIIPNLISDRLSKAQKARLASLEDYFKRISDLLSDFALLNPFSIKQIRQRAETASEDVADKTQKYGSISSFKNNLNAFFLQLIGAAVIIYAAVLLKQNTITIGAAIASMSYIDNFLYPIQYILNAVNQLHSVKEVKLEVEEDLRNPLMKSSKSVEPVAFTPIVLNDVVTTFMTAHVSTKIPKGAKVWLKGHSGSGKTTLLNIIAGYETDFSGTLQQNNDIFYNTQFAHVFDTDFMSNITIFDSFPETPTIEELLSRLSIGKENLMNAKTISGGQKQMITFIRAMNSPYDVLLMDEPFSSVDAKHADILLQYALESDKTIIMTSHTQLSEQDFTQVISL